MQPQELCDVRVAEAGHQPAFLKVLANYPIHTLIFHMYEGLMELLTSTQKMLVGYLNRCTGPYLEGGQGGRPPPLDL